MQPSTAVELIHNLTYFPEFSFHAEENDRHAGVILLRVSYRARQTSRAAALDNYREFIDANAGFFLAVDDVDSHDALYRKVANVLLRIYAHEMREALRVSGTFHGPFHPHKLDGMRAWIATADVSDDAIVGDLDFGGANA